VKTKNTHYWLFWLLCLGIILVSYSSYFIWGSKSFLSVGDGLDSNHVQNLMSAEKSWRFGEGEPSESIKVAADPGVVGFVKKIPGPQKALYIFFQPYYADVINRVLISLIGFLGMLLLLSAMYPRSRYPGLEFEVIRFGVALAFGLLKFWPYAGISVSGLPLIFWAYLSVDRHKLWAFLTAVVYAYYSSLALVGVFLLIALGISELWLWIKKRGSWRRVLWIAFLTLVYVLANISLVMSALAPKVASHRSGFSAVGFFADNQQTVLNFLRMFFSNYGHNASYPWLIIPLGLLALLLAFKGKSPEKRKHLILLGAYTILALAGAIFGNRYIYSLQSRIPLLKMFQLQRFFWLLPLLQYLIFASSLVIVAKTRLKKAIYPLLLVQIGILAFYVNYNTKQCVKSYVLNKPVSPPSYEEFYSPALYRGIQRQIGRPTTEYRVASLGLNPAAALYNGFYTVDGYFSGGYPLEHKQNFGKAIEGELEKNEHLATLFYNWGSTCYLFSDEIDRYYGYNGNGIPMIDKHEERSIEYLAIDTASLRDMDCEYIFSALPISQAGELGLNYVASYEHSSSPYRIYLYSIE